MPVNRKAKRILIPTIAILLRRSRTHVKCNALLFRSSLGFMALSQTAGLRMGAWVERFQIAE
jgi:hypothetical protein